MVQRYASGVVVPAPLSWYAVPMIKWDIINIIVLYDEREDDAGELDEDLGLCGRIEHDGEEVDEGAGDRTAA